MKKVIITDTDIYEVKEIKTAEELKDLQRVARNKKLQKENEREAYIRETEKRLAKCELELAFNRGDITREEFDELWSKLN